MKLQRQLSRKVGGIEYPKWVVTIPPKNIKKLKWKEGIELEALIESGEIRLKPKKSTP